MKITAVVLWVVLFCAALSGCATTSDGQRVSRLAPRHFTGSGSKLPTFDIPITVNERVVAWLDYFQGPGKNHFARYLARSGRYIPEMQEILAKYALPQDLVYIAMIESGFSSKAYSRARASGFWQFIGSTGKRYGLAINHWVDERRDPEKSTIAAAKYLRDLFDEFGDWYLAMAAYNAGEGKIGKAIKRNGTRDFWRMIDHDHRFLRAETKDYVPKFIAAAIISKSPERFGFGDVVYDQPVELEKSTVSSQTDLQVVARCAGVETMEIADLNPELVRGATPPSTGDYRVNLPKGKGRAFETAYAGLPPSERMMVARHVVRRGETIGRIARRYGVTVRELLAANDLRSTSHLRKGMNLIIPTGGAAKEVVRRDVAGQTVAGKHIKHRVEQGETLGLIAQNYGATISDLKRWNKLKRNLIHVGQTLRIYGVEDQAEVEVATKGKRVSGKTSSYLVRRGDSWWRVAQKYGVSINDLKGWNMELGDKDLRIGQRLKLFTSSPATNISSTVASSFSVSERLPEPDQSTKVESELLSFRDANAATETGSLKLLKYQIKGGDTLWDIAKKYGVSVSDIIGWNHLSTVNHKRLKPGNFIVLHVLE